MKFVFASLLFISIITHADTGAGKLTGLKLTSGVNFNFLDGQKIKTRVFGYKFRADYNYKFSEDVSLFFDASAVLQTGSNEVVNVVNEFEPQENINLNAGGLIYNPVNILSIEAGALNQARYSSPLFLTAVPFASILEKIVLGPFYFSAQQGIPSNNRLSQRLNQIDKGSPFFGIQTLGFDIGEKDRLKVEVSHFIFNDLSNNIAFFSKVLGNSASGESELNSEFLYEFEGYNVHLDSQVDFKSFGLRFSGQYLYNDKAPSGRNLGTLGTLGVYVGKYEVFAETFRNESDTTPAYYNSKYYGHNDIQGTGGGFKIVEEEFDFAIRFSTLKPISENSIHTKTEIVTFDFNHTLPSF